MLDPQPAGSLFDLYCGYGLFSLCLASRANKIVGVELSHEAIDAARINASRLHVPNAQFHQAAIDAESAARLLQHMRTEDMVILDPPRGGTAQGVIECIAAKSPAKVLHLFCNLEVMPGELARWGACGYEVSAVTSFDMFPGTPSVEVMVLLRPGADKSAPTGA